MKKPDIYGLMAEFDSPEEILAAALKASETGYRKMDAYTPFPMEELTDALRIKHTRLSLFVLCCGIVGCLTGFFMQYYSMGYDYPLNIGGRPLNSWPQWIPITFEMTILFAALGTFIGVFFRNGLPRPVHPVFNVDRFELASRDKFFLCIESTDPKFNREATKVFLETLKPANIFVVDH
ncbi:MAG: DUF3341 domain-containing protein [Bacteroidota bacterium]